MARLTAIKRMIQDLFCSARIFGVHQKIINMEFDTSLSITTFLGNVRAFVKSIASQSPISPVLASLHNLFILPYAAFTEMYKLCSYGLILYNAIDLFLECLQSI